MKAYSFSFNTSDWLASPAVRMMSKAERGVYINLLALAWEAPQQGTLPANAEKVRRLAEMSAEEWAESGDVILEKFPLSECGQYRFNPRLILEAEKQEAKREVNAEAGRRSAEKRAAEKAAKEAAELRLQPKGNANPTPVEIIPTPVADSFNESSTISKVELSKEQYPTVASAKAEPAGLDFDSFWSAYDRKEGSKKKMEKQWNGLKLATRQLILNGLPAYKQAKTVNGSQFLPMPQTFLNGAFWEAESYGAQQQVGQYRQPAQLDPETDRLRAFSQQQAQQPAPAFVYKSGPNQPGTVVKEPQAAYTSTLSPR